MPVFKHEFDSKAFFVGELSRRTKIMTPKDRRKIVTKEAK